MNLQVRRAAWRGRQAVHLPSAFHRPLLGILLGRGHRPGRGVSPPGCLNVLRGSGKEKPGGHRLRAPGLGWRGGGGDNWMDMPPRRHPSTPSTPGPLRASGARNSLSPTLIAIRWRKWKITALGNWRAMVPGACAQQEDESASPTPAGTWGTEPKPGAGGAGARGWWGEAFPWVGEQGSPPCPGPTFSWPRGAQGNSEQRFPCGTHGTRIGGGSSVSIFRTQKSAASAPAPELQAFCWPPAPGGAPCPHIQCGWGCSAAGCSWAPGAFVFREGRGAGGC